MRQPVFRGAATALVTPFNDHGVDQGKLARLIDFQIAGGIDALVICGTTGEASTMTTQEHVGAVASAVRLVNGRVPVLAGAGSNDTRHAIEQSKRLADVGADALLSVTPYYNKTTQSGLVAHYSAIAQAVDLPVILYNVPGRTSLNIAPATLGELSQIDNIVGVKECNTDQLGESINLCAPDFAFYTGEDPNMITLLAWGGVGVISVLANVIPGDTHDLVAKWTAGDIAGARALQLKMLPLIKALFCEVNPIPVRAALDILGFDLGAARLPLVPATPATHDLLVAELARYGVDPIS
ncbi:MAG: 4-hydroxy-tetrahydrodipicolinate synthase [Propionibacteriaceae bacterium]|jgi:4-hydroxy-tetrahydrodipicolinate synthase|nr:4-hydroxy-tetrahydrodipicolinate synthase [Propionibacteriaceae bacterium]